MFWFVAICCFDDGPTPEFQADLISSGQSIPCKLEDLRVGKAIVLEVRISNKLEEPIEIDRVEPSCGCTVATIDGDKKIEPQKALTVKMSLKIEDPGIFEKPVFFYKKGADSSDRLVSVKFTLDEKSPIWQVPSGVLKFSTASESVEVPFVFQE
jgi:hypothetical protein